MSSPEKVVELVKLIDNLITLKDTQDRKDSWYGGFVKLYHKETELLYNKLDTTPTTKKNFHLMLTGISYEVRDGLYRHRPSVCIQRCQHAISESWHLVFKWP